MTLTEQWKKGELEKNRRYYVRDGEKIFTSYLDEYNCFLQSREEDTYQEYEEYTTYCDEVLAPVPSYDRFCRLNHLENDFIKAHERINKLEKENQQLKDLLKECRPYVDQAMPISFNDNDIGWKPWQINRCTILTKIDNAIGEKK